MMGSEWDKYKQGFTRLFNFLYMVVRCTSVVMEEYSIR